MGNSQLTVFAEHQQKLHWWACRHDAIKICYEMTRQISKTGGGRQRGEGVPMLFRVIKRIREVPL